ncbi:hypothetical protein Q0590_23775 [Rhodocytophaga aerolata]|uniref:Macroglobulin domain-containing protein n=1 Tax=Rhodocytophaga aerolata TaxID=455078 RepID=A0ABT8RB32_9BACT|nr:hypothetical protein [Rhodocytophaga aerolata]MDO1449315.1 hypothetical protein [Rhodocytophaga aerolata]
MNCLFNSLKILLSGSLFLLSSYVDGYSQEARLANIVSSFESYTKTTSQEKIFVHTDKDFYVAGEIIWFKIYCMDAASHKPVVLTKVAYLEIISESHKPVGQAKISLSLGTGHGSLSLPFTLTSGKYKIRAYTRWMKNFSPEFHFEKNITIVNSLVNLDINSAKRLPVYSIHFFPEGGNLVEGIQSKVAFKITDQFGQGVEGKGVILNQNNDTLAQVEPFKFGMGYFFLKPEPGDDYNVQLQTNDGKTIRGALPDVYSQGYVLTLENTDANTISISVWSNVPAAGNSPVYLLAHTRQVIQVAQAQNLREGKALFRIDKSKLGEGISHITIFDKNGIALCERLYCKLPEQKLLIEASTNQPQYHIRQKVIVDILTSTSGRKPESTTMSLSVFRLDSLQQPEPSTIQRYVWLGSDLTGTIEHPDYYFSHSNEEAEQALDNLMLTQGWRRFRWEEILQNNTPSFDFVPEHEGHIISGSITDKRTGLPASATTYLSIPGKRIQLYGAISDQNGKLVFNTKDLYGENKLVLQTQSQQDSILHITIDSPFSSQFSTRAFPEFLPSPLHLGLLADQSVAMQVQHIFAANKGNEFSYPPVDSTPFYHTPEKTYRLDDFTRFPTMEEVIREYVQEAGVRKRQGKLHFQVVDRSNETFFTKDPLVLLDGLPVINTDKFFAMDPRKIEKLEVIPRRYFWGPLIAEGILSFTTYTHNLSGYELDPHALIVDYDGLQQKREFYQPAYEHESQQKSRLPDLRNVLVWSPECNTGASGKKQLSFYTSDQTGKFIGVIQGITRNGEVASHTFTFEVLGE